jgi:hypothetical protein
MRILTVLFTLFFITGCPSLTATRSLSSLQTDFGAIVRTQDQCDKASTLTETCFSDFEAMHADIEIQTIEAINEVKDSVDDSDLQISVALYRLAAFASLKANTNQAAKHGDEGSMVCETLAGKGKAPPRDCALLAVIGQYELVEAFSANVDCLLADDCETSKTADALASGYCNIYNKLDSKTESAKQQPLLPIKVSNYLDQRLKQSRKPMQNFASKLTPKPVSAEPEKPCDCVEMSSSDADFAESCGNLDATTRMATFKAMCISKSLDADEPSCPSY